MIERIDLRYFKCFELLKLPISDLTILTGTNASGKSSVMQALVLLHQTMREHEWSTRLLLNGEAVKLGTVLDVVDKVNGRRTFEVVLVDSRIECGWVFEGDRPDMSMSVQSVSVDDSATLGPTKLRYLLPVKSAKAANSLVDRVRGLTYITAERIGPREFYSLSDSQAAPVVGTAGENTVCVLHLGRDAIVNERLVIAGIPPTRLPQVEARMRLFFPGCGISLQQIPQANALTLGLRTSDATDFHRPIHVGFGITQILPIVVAALSAAPGDLLLIENPEVHLHPSGQSLMGLFLAEVAASGVQLLIETHSDHLLNGVRRAVKTNCLPSKKVAIHFFTPRASSASQVLSPQINSQGDIDKWPDGFFDQFDKDASYFAGWGD